MPIKLKFVGAFALGSRLDRDFIWVSFPMRCPHHPEGISDIRSSKASSPREIGTFITRWHLTGGSAAVFSRRLHFSERLKKLPAFQNNCEYYLIPYSYRIAKHNNLRHWEIELTSHLPFVNTNFRLIGCRNPKSVGCQTLDHQGYGGPVSGRHRSGGPILSLVVSMRAAALYLNRYLRITQIYTMF